MRKIEVLKKKISDADYKYYTLASPDIDDYKYDLMMKELEKLEKEFPSSGRMTLYQQSFRRTYKIFSGQFSIRSQCSHFLIFIILMNLLNLITG
ncbi:MAG: hypothetical protein R3A12_07025 [Ignavibacteria bacterium]